MFHSKNFFWWIYSSVQTRNLADRIGGLSWWSILRVQILRRGHKIFLFLPVSSCRKGIVPMIYVYYEKWICTIKKLETRIFSKLQSFYRSRSFVEICLKWMKRVCVFQLGLIPSPRYSLSPIDLRPWLVSLPCFLFFGEFPHNLTMILKTEKKYHHIHGSNKKYDWFFHLK